LRFFSDDSSENLTKEQILKREADKKAVRDHEQKKSRVGRAVEDLADIGVADESGITLNRLWKRVRDFLNDVDLEGDKIELLKGQEPARIRFMTAC
jgi:K+-sensing histidine kinase KdpD